MNETSSFGGKRAEVLDDSGLEEAKRPLNPYLDVYSGYGHAVEIFHCPSDRYPASGGDPKKRNVFVYCGNSYKANQYLVRPQTVPFVSLSSITVPHSKLNLTMDAVLNATPYHGGQMPYINVNILFLDGHVKMHKFNADLGSGYINNPTP